MTTCPYCKKPVVLSPSAADRARKYGGKPEDYTGLFTAHSQCLIEERQRQVSALIEHNRNLGKILDLIEYNRKG